MPKNKNQQFEFDFSPLQDVETSGGVTKITAEWYRANPQTETEDDREFRWDTGHGSNYDAGQKFLRNPRRGVE